MTRTTSRDYEIVVDRFQTDPMFFMRRVLGCRPWEKQIEIAEAVRDHKEVAVRSAHSIGKDWIAARIVLWFLYSHYPAIVITTGPTDRQVKGILWREIALAYQRAKAHLGGELLTQELKIDSDRWAIGFTSGDDPNRFQGFHSKNILVIIDEACGVAPSTYTAVDALLTSENSRKLEIGNPTDSASSFAKSFKTPGIHKITIDAFDTPNMKKFGISAADIATNHWREKITGPLPKPELITPEWVATRYKRWGENNPLYQSRVMAKFPEAGEDVLIPLSLIEAAQQRYLPAGEPNIIAADIARFGSDYNVICQRRGPVVRRLSKFTGVDTMVTAGHVLRALNDTKAAYANIDVVGLGAGVVDRLREQGKPVREFNGGQKAHDSESYLNARAECYWTLRGLFERGEIDIDPADEDLAADLSDIKWKPDSKGRVVIEPKEDMKKRIGHSPDEADAVSMLFMPERLKAPTFYSHPGRIFSDARPRF